MTDIPKPRRFRFSLRALLLLVTIASAGFGWLGYKVRQVQRQKEAVVAIEKLGGSVVYDYEIDMNGSMLQRPTPRGPIWLRAAIGDDLLVNVVRVNGFNRLRGPVRDADLLSLQELTQLSYLNLILTKISDAGLVHLRGLTKLQVLYLELTSVTDAGLVYLEELNRLKVLSLARTQITDAGLTRLRMLTQLEQLNLDRTSVTDAGLVHLHGLTNLREVSIEQTAVTPEACQALQTALPNLKISWSPREISEPE
jgi:hypothetical protein